MIEPRETSEHGRIDALLPWFANGTLRNGERKAVERHLAECEECRRNLGVLERARARLAHETTVPILPEPPVEKFLETIDDKALPRRGFSARRGLAAAAGVVLLVSAAFFAGRTGAPDPASIYETATSGSSSAAMNYVVSLDFAADTTMEQRARVVQLLGARELEISGDGLVYEVIVRLEAAALEDVQAYTDTVRALPEVNSVKITAVQLPVRDGR